VQELASLTKGQAKVAIIDPAVRALFCCSSSPPLTANNGLTPPGLKNDFCLVLGCRTSPRTWLSPLFAIFSSPHPRCVIALRRRSSQLTFQSGPRSSGGATCLLSVREESSMRRLGGCSCHWPHEVTGVLITRRRGRTMLLAVQIWLIHRNARTVRPLPLVMDPDGQWRAFSILSKINKLLERNRVAGSGEAKLRLGLRDEL
jgi:hypothetical protein